MPTKREHKKDAHADVSVDGFDAGWNAIASEIGTAIELLESIGDSSRAMVSAVRILRSICAE